MKRRTLLIGGGVVAVAGAGLLLARPEEKGMMHTAYFKGLSAALRRANLNKPVLVIDRARLNANIAAIRKSVEQAKLPLRIVAKSLPAPNLIDEIAKGIASDRLMLFSADMLTQSIALRPTADYLMGKPLPVSEFTRVADMIGSAATDRVQWLIDTPLRLSEYSAAAKARGIVLNANFEIDVGLHRGGFNEPAQLAETVKAAIASGAKVSGLMGYDPHVPNVPNPDAAHESAQTAYGKAIGVLKVAGLDPATLTLNTAGSPTFRRHCKNTVANEVSVGSAFVKPGGFDFDDLADLVSAAFIATPVLKASASQDVPGLDSFSGAVRWWDRNTQRGFFIHGGHWLAKPTSPEGLEYSSLFGRSSNQELLTGSKKIDLKPGDTVFLRPDQSEALFLQFGEIAIYDGGEISAFWMTLPISA